MASNRVYFPNLNSSRFIGAIAVIIHHIEMTKHWFGQPNIYTNSFIGGMFGQAGIIFFFVLSGFLITYLLMLEHEHTKTISIKNFYIRRVLRIWPLYYFIIILGLFILPKISFLFVPGFTEYVNDGMLPKSLMFFTFFSNLAYTMYEHVPYAEQAWSVGVEEQFYLLWPILVLLVIKRGKLLHMLIGVILFYLLVKIIAIYLHTSNSGSVAYYNFYQFWHHFSIDCMAIGGISAYILYNKKEKLLKLIYNKYVQIATYLLLAFITVKGLVLPYFTYELYALMFFIIVLNLAANPKTIINIEYKPLNYLGKISYGIYMYHNIMIVISLKLVMLSSLALSGVWGNVLLYTLAFGLTIFTATLSYEFFEQRFIKAKMRFSKVLSGENAVEKKAVSRQKKEPAMPMPVIPKTV